MSSGFDANIASEVELVPANCFSFLDFQTVFHREGQVEVDLGCGDGSFLVALAAANPATSFLGIERLVGRVRRACRKIEEKGLTNARVLRFEISYAVKHLLPPDSVTRFHLLFPDPWPKRRHAPRRLVTEDFLAALHRALCANGTVRIATDETSYFRQIQALVSQSSIFAVNPQSDRGPETKFERRFRERGVAIQRLELRKISPVT